LVLRPGPIQSPLAGPRLFGGSRRSLLLLVSAADLADNQLLRMPVGKGGHRQIGHVGIDTRAPVRDLGATCVGGRGLVAGLMC
jgi:hypothetical protein